jgi:hypothetical protein
MKPKKTAPGMHHIHVNDGRPLASLRWRPVCFETRKTQTGGNSAAILCLKRRTISSAHSRDLRGTLIPLVTEVPANRRRTSTFVYRMADAPRKLPCPCRADRDAGLGGRAAKVAVTTVNLWTM